MEFSGNGLGNGLSRLHGCLDQGSVLSSYEAMNSNGIGSQNQVPKASGRL